MATPVEMPKLGNSVEECLLAKWVRRPGDVVSTGDVVAEIETDKATFEVPSPVDGTLLAVFFEEGSLVPVYTNIFVVGVSGEDASAFTPRPVTAPATADKSVAPAAAPDTVEPVTTSVLSPRARRFAREHGMEVAGVAGSGPNGRVLEQDVRDLYHSAAMSPVARRRAAEGLRAPQSGGSGPGGLIVSTDLAEAGAPLSRMREKIAQRMRDSLAHTAQYTLTSSADANRLLAVRSRVKQQHPDLNINALVLFCAVKALLRMPQLNAEFREGVVTIHDRVHLGFACDTERGLLVPVIHDAGSMTAIELAAAAKALAARATDGTLPPDDLAGATFTVSNLGALGIESFTPILNPPQVAILGVNSIELRPVRTERGFEMVDRIGLSLTCDHQVIDGAPGARFLGVVRECIERVDTLAFEDPCTT